MVFGDITKEFRMWKEISWKPGIEFLINCSLALAIEYRAVYCEWSASISIMIGCIQVRANACTYVLICWRLSADAVDKRERDFPCLLVGVLPDNDTCPPIRLIIMWWFILKLSYFLLSCILHLPLETSIFPPFLV